MASTPRRSGLLMAMSCIVSGVIVGSAAIAAVYIEGSKALTSVVREAAGRGPRMCYGMRTSIRQVRPIDKQRRPTAQIRERAAPGSAQDDDHVGAPDAVHPLDVVDAERRRDVLGRGLHPGVLVVHGGDLGVPAGRVGGRGARVPRGVELLGVAGRQALGAGPVEDLDRRVVVGRRRRLRRSGRGRGRRGLLGRSRCGRGGGGAALLSGRGGRPRRHGPDRLPVLAVRQKSRSGPAQGRNNDEDDQERPHVLPPGRLRAVHADWHVLARTIEFIPRIL